MRTTSFLLLLAPSISALQLQYDPPNPLFAPFLESTQANLTSSPPPLHNLLPRDGNCPTNHNSCSTLAAADGAACCTSGTVCSLDAAKNIACCPSGASCTGTITRGTISPTPTTTTVGTGTNTLSIVSNPYFPYPIIPTSYANSALCSAAVSACLANYAACTADLQDISFGVTIVAPGGGGVTVAPTLQNLGVASATSICGSLSSVACGVQSGGCAAFGTATTTSGGFVVATSVAGAMVTKAPVWGAAVGVGLGMLIV